MARSASLLAGGQTARGVGRSPTLVLDRVMREARDTADRYFGDRAEPAATVSAAAAAAKTAAVPTETVAITVAVAETAAKADCTRAAASDRARRRRADVRDQFDRAVANTSEYAGEPEPRKAAAGGKYRNSLADIA